MKPAQVECKRDEVLVIGESLMDIVQTPTGALEYVGGSPANVAYGLGRLGLPTALVTAIADDERGHRVRKHLQKESVRVLPEAGVLGRTSTATASLDTEGAADYDFDIDWTLPELTTDGFPRLIHTGSIASFLQPGAINVRNLVSHFAGSVPITYDANIRPELVGSSLHARDTFEDLLPFLDVVKLSDEDAAWLYPGQTLEKVAQVVVEFGPKLVAVTQGSGGSTLWTAEFSVSVPAPEVSVADTIGAGDSYMSALIAALLAVSLNTLNRDDLFALGNVASRAAAFTVSRPGANPPRRRDLPSLSAFEKNRP